MKTLLLTTLLAFAAADKHCKGVYFKDKYYDITILKEGLNQIHQLALNRNDNILYFTFEEFSSQPSTQVAYFVVDTGEVGVINGVRNATAIAIDQSANKVFIGGADGIYKLNADRTVQTLPVKDEIKSMFFKGALFYTNARKQAFLFENNYINPVFELQGVEADNLVLDDDYNIFFTQGPNLFRVKFGTRAINSHERYNVDVLATDADLKPYIATDNGVYVYNKYKYVLDKVSDIRNIKALTFSKLGEPFYAVKDLLVKLMPNPLACFED